MAQPYQPGYGQPNYQGQPTYGQPNYQEQPNYGNGPSPYSMQQPQNYPPPNQPPQFVQQGEKFNQQPLFDPPKPKWNDLWAAILFYLNMAGFIVVAVISLRALASTGSGTLGSGDTGVTLNKSTAYVFALITAAGFLFSVIFLGIVRLFTRAIFEITLVLSVLVSVGYAVYMWTQKYYSGAIIFTIFAVFAIIAYPFMRKRIPFSKAILITTLRVADQYKSVYVLAILGATFTAVYSVFWSFVLAAAYQKFQPNAAGSDVSGGSGQGALIVVCIFLVFHLYWTTQVFNNVLLATEAGIFGTWYFSGMNLPKSPAFGAFKRSMSYSFGSICFGSLIVAVLDFLRAVLQTVMNQEAAGGDTIGYAIACCAQCCLGCITGLVEYFNRYAYIEISLFGKAYIPAAKDTWNLMKKRGIDALINDCLVNNIWTFGSFLVGGLCCLFAYLYVHLVNPGFAQNGSSITAIILFYSFTIGFFICHTLGYSALSAGVSTLFVGIAEEPQALQQKDPELHRIIAEKYPHILTAV